MTNEREELRQKFLDSINLLSKHDRAIIHLLALHLEGVDRNVDAVIEEIGLVAAKVADIDYLHIANAVALVAFSAQSSVTINPLIESNKKWAALDNMEISK